MVPSATDVLAGVPGRAALPDEDVTGEDFLACGLGGSGYRQCVFSIGPYTTPGD